MRKGVSPVVATVLLIAIAVISSVAVWYWVSTYTSSQPVPQTTQKAYVITSDYLNSSGTGCYSLDLRNVGGSSINNVILEIRDYSSGKQVGSNGTNPPVNAYINITVDLTSGNAYNYNISLLGNASNRTSVPLGTYFLRPSVTYSASVAGLSDTIFTCS